MAGYDKKSGLPISIIVPAYNVAAWIDECIYSIVNQTFDHFEILLINDGSTDGTHDKCVKWSQSDSRIKYYKRLHGGLSAARNFGISIAQGEYLLFVDSDDWLEKDYAEKLYYKALESQADIVECDFWRYNNMTGEKTYRPSYGRMGIPYTREERLLYGESVVWKCLFKKDIWRDYQIEFPNCLGASHVTYVLFLLLGVKFESIREPLYYYRRMRKGSILDENGKGSKEEGRMGIDEMEALLDELKERSLFNENRNLIQRAIKYRMSDLLASQYGRKEYSEYRTQRENYYKFFQESFPNFKNERYVVVGGYNLNRILAYLDCIQDPYCRFNFSSIVSIVNPISYSREITHVNIYRQRMIDKDIKSLFWEIVEEINPKYLFLDLVDDRFGVARLADGYFTCSNAYYDVRERDDNVSLIRVGDEAYNELWKKSVCTFFEKILRNISRKHIVVIENYLTTMHGNSESQVAFDDVEQINSINELLKKKYDYIRENYQDIIWIDAYKEKQYFTDDEYEYGSIPEHLNEIVNRRIANCIENKIARSEV